MTATTSLAEVARRDLADLNDRMVGPGDPGYDDARAVHNGMIDRHPALLVRCQSADDVACGQAVCQVSVTVLWSLSPSTVTVTVCSPRSGAWAGTSTWIVVSFQPSAVTAWSPRRLQAKMRLTTPVVAAVRARVRV